MTPPKDWLSELRETAQGATPGPWIPEDRSWGANNGVIVEDVNADGVCTVHNHHGSRSWTRFVAVPAHDHSCEIGSETHRNMQFIAAFNPQVVLKLLQQLETAREALELVKSKEPDFADARMLTGLAYAARLELCVMTATEALAELNMDPRQ